VYSQLKLPEDLARVLLARPVEEERQSAMVVILALFVPRTILNALIIQKEDIQPNNY
jgi:hypothetical protein